MTWTNEHSPPEEIALEKAWSALNAILDRRVRVSVQMRVTACVHDVLTFMMLLRELEAAEAGRLEKLGVGRNEWKSEFSFQYAAALKATYYFVRSLQDAIYAALLEANGHRAGSYTSMHDCAKKGTNPIRLLIEQALPDYFGWFAGFRDIRNDMKLGASTSFGFRSDGLRRVRVTLQNIDDAKRYVSHGRELSLADVEVCLRQSAQLLQFAADHVEKLKRQTASSDP